jgi:hypothetical protein
MINYTSNSDEDLIVKNYRKVTRHNVPKSKIIAIQIEGAFNSIENNRAKIWINTFELARKYFIITSTNEIDLIEFVLTQDVKYEGNIFKLKTGDNIELKANWNKEYKKFYLNNIIKK